MKFKNIKIINNQIIGEAIAETTEDKKLFKHWRVVEKICKGLPTIQEMINRERK